MHNTADRRSRQEPNPTHPSWHSAASCSSSGSPSRCSTSQGGCARVSQLPGSTSAGWSSPLPDATAVAPGAPLAVPPPTAAGGPSRRSCSSAVASRLSSHACCCFSCAAAALLGPRILWAAVKPPAFGAGANHSRSASAGATSPSPRRGDCPGLPRCDEGDCWPVSDCCWPVASSSSPSPSSASSRCSPCDAAPGCCCCCRRVAPSPSRRLYSTSAAAAGQGVFSLGQEAGQCASSEQHARFSLPSRSRQHAPHDLPNRCCVLQGSQND